MAGHNLFPLKKATKTDTALLQVRHVPQLPVKMEENVRRKESHLVALVSQDLKENNVKKGKLNI